MMSGELGADVIARDQPVHGYQCIEVGPELGRPWSTADLLLAGACCPDYGGNR